MFTGAEALALVMAVLDGHQRAADQDDPVDSALGKARATWQRLVTGRTADDAYPEAVADADRAFALLRTGAHDATDAGS